MASDTEIKCKMVEKMLRNQIIGDHTMPVKAVADRYLATHDVGRGKELLENEMVPHREAGIEKVGGGARNTVHISDPSEAVEFLDRHDGNIPWGWE